MSAFPTALEEAEAAWTTAIDEVERECVRFLLLAQVDETGELMTYLEHTLAVQGAGALLLERLGMLAIRTRQLRRFEEYRLPEAPVP